jgi:hypothetical protein
MMEEPQMQESNEENTFLNFDLVIFMIILNNDLRVDKSLNVSILKLMNVPLFLNRHIIFMDLSLNPHNSINKSFVIQFFLELELNSYPGGNS